MHTHSIDTHAEMIGDTSFTSIATKERRLLFGVCMFSLDDFLNIYVVMERERGESVVLCAAN